jgi:L-cystine uptake protein TcyP (sodium:dicarboxylate symporter family)
MPLLFDAGASVYVAPGFNVTTFNATSASGAGQLYVNITAQQVNLQTSSGWAELKLRRC